MRRSLSPVNGWLLSIILLLTGIGFVIFLSASVGLVARDGGADFHSIVFTQTLFGLLPGLGLMYLLSRLNYKILREWAFFIFIGSVVLTLLVFVPHIGFGYNGAH